MVISYLFDIDDTIGKIKSNIDYYNPKKIISLGDSFHESDTLNIISVNYVNTYLNELFKTVGLYI